MKRFVIRAAALICVATVLAVSPASATTPPLSDPVVVFVDWAQDQGTPVVGPACYVPETGPVTCYGIAAGSVVVVGVASPDAAGNVSDFTPVPVATGAAATTVVPPSTIAPTTVAAAAGAGDVQACRAVTEAIGEFASTGSRQWVTGSANAISISVSALEWWNLRAALESAVLAALALPENPALTGVLLELSNVIADDLSEEWDNPDQSVFPSAVYEKVDEIDALSRRLESTCRSLGIEVDAFHPLNADGTGGVNP